MLEDSEPPQLVDKTKRGTDATLGDEDVKIDVAGFYFNHPEDSHQVFSIRNVEWVPTDDAIALTLTITAIKIYDNQNLKVSNSLGA